MPEPTIVCIGAANMDSRAHVRGPVRPAASNPVALSTRVGGVACNVARNLSRLENRVALIAAVGRDPDGDRVAEAVADAGVNQSGLVRSDLPTGSYVVVVDEDGELVIGLAAMEISDAMGPAALAERIDRLGDAGAVMVDANLPPETLALVAEKTPADRPIFAATVSPAKAPRLHALMPRLSGLFANRREAAVLAGLDPEDPVDPVELAARLHATGSAAVFVTLGPDGAAAATAGLCGQLKPPASRPVQNVNGAGDGFMAGVIDAVLLGRGTEDALRQGLAVASLTCESDEAANPALSPAAVAARSKIP